MLPSEAFSSRSYGTDTQLLFLRALIATLAADGLLPTLVSRLPPCLPHTVCLQTSVSEQGCTVAALV